MDLLITAAASAEGSKAAQYTHVWQLILTRYRD
jgi:hypothetical protein